MVEARDADARMPEITDFDVERRKKFVDLRPDDIARILAVKDVVAQHVDEHTAAFFDYLARLEEAATLFRNRELLEEAKQLKRQHLGALVQGDYGKHYVEQRIKLGALYSRGQVDSRVFLGAFHHLISSIGNKITERFKTNSKAAFAHLTSISKVAFFDLGIIVDIMVANRERTIELQQEAIRELSTPTLQIRDRLLILPIIGLIDSHRARQLTDGLLHAIRAKRAKVVVMDITGVGTVDSKVANHLMQTVAAARLMGATTIITGLSADVAQSLVALGVNLGSLNTVGDLQGGLEEAERLLGYELVSIKDHLRRHSAE